MAKKTSTEHRDPIIVSTKQPAAPGVGPVAASGASTGAASASPNCLRIVDGQTATTGSSNQPQTLFASVYLIAYIDALSPMPQTDGTQPLDLSLPPPSTSSYTLRFCSGVFISDNVLLTASHCLPPAGTSLMLLGNAYDASGDRPHVAQAVRSQQIFAGNPGEIPSGYTPPLGKSQQDQDFGMVIYPSGTASSWSPLAVTTRPPGTSVTLVGYGRDFNINNVVQDLTPLKRYGQNTLYSVKNTAWAWADDPYLYFLRGRKVASETPFFLPDALTGHGDSGGPIFAGATVLGTVISGYSDSDDPNLVQELGADALSIYFNVTAPTFAVLAGAVAAAGGHLNYETTPSGPAPLSAAPSSPADNAVAPVNPTSPPSSGSPSVAAAPTGGCS